MSRDYALEVVAGTTFRTTCRGCGQVYEAPHHSWVDAWRAGHTILCPTPRGPKT